MVEQKWRVRLSAAAELDFANIIKWTVDNFGALQARIYRDLLDQAIDELTGGPEAMGSRRRNEIMQGLRTLHIARRGRRGRHFLAYFTAAEQTIEIVRILHERMDLPRHLPSDLDKSSE